jgi:hypothetical protein
MADVLDAIAPIGGDGGFPLPQLVQSQGLPGQPSYTFEGPQINGLNMPGQWILAKGARVFGWQKQVANFMSGGTVVPTGDSPMDIEYEVRIWESGTFAAFRQVLQTLLKKPVVSLGAAVPESAALGIHDPALKDLGVTKVVVAFVDYPKNPLITSGGKGPWVGKVGFIEYRKGIAALPVPNQDIPDPGAVTPAAAANQAVAAAAIAAGNASRSTATANRLVPPK